MYMNRIDEITGCVSCKSEKITTLLGDITFDTITFNSRRYFICHATSHYVCSYRS